MSIDFPSSPTTGQVYTENDLSWKFNGTSWDALVEAFTATVEGVNVLSSGETGGSKFLREDGDGTCSWISIPGGGDALTSNPLSQFASTTKAQLNGVISDGTPMYVGDPPTAHTHVKADITDFSDADYATAAQGTTADNALPKSGGAMTGPITTNSTFDGRDVATDGTKLDGIETSADVTDTTNVTAAGALMDSEVTNLAQVKAFDSSDYAAALGADDNYVTDAEKVVIGNTSGTNTGDQDLSPYATEVIDGTPNTDHSANGPQTNTFNAGATIAAGEFLYMATDGEWALADASVTATSEKLISVALEGGTDGNPLLVALPGSFVRDDSWTWTAGDTIYLSLTAGDGSATVAATATDEVSRIIGYAVSADVIYLQPQQGVVRA